MRHTDQRAGGIEEIDKQESEDDCHKRDVQRPRNIKLHEGWRGVGRGRHDALEFIEAKDGRHGRHE